MSSTKSNNQTLQLAADQKLIDGLVKHASDIPSLVLGTKTVTNAELVSGIQQLIALTKASASARVALSTAVASSKAARLAQRPILQDLKLTLQARFSTDKTTLADFGLTPRKQGRASPKTQVAAAAKATATRAARGTKGSKELSAVHGDVTGVVVTPVKTVAAPAEPPAPAPVAPTKA